VLRIIGESFRPEGVGGAHYSAVRSRMKADRHASMSFSGPSVFCLHHNAPNRYYSLWGMVAIGAAPDVAAQFEDIVLSNSGRCC